MPERQHASGSDMTMNDSVITSRARLLAARWAPAATTPATAAAGRRTIGHQRRAEGNTRLERTPPEILLRGCGGVERLADLRLQSRLLVEADLEVRKDRELRAHVRIALAASAFVVRERLAQVTLALRRLARSEPVEEALERAGIGRAGRALVQVARELEPDLLEDLQVPARHGVAGPLEGVERRVQRAGQAAEPGLALEEAPAQQPPPQRRDRVQQPAPDARACVRGARAGPRLESSAPPAAMPTSHTCTSSRPSPFPSAKLRRDASSSG